MLMYVYVLDQSKHTDIDTDTKEYTNDVDVVPEV